MLPLRILIVGGGIAGLALGRALAEQGVVLEIIERAASWPTSWEWRSHRDKSGSVEVVGRNVHVSAKSAAASETPLRFNIPHLRIGTEQSLVQGLAQARPP